MSALAVAAMWYYVSLNFMPRLRTLAASLTVALVVLEFLPVDMWSYYAY
jgi:hypothetical protein